MPKKTLLTYHSNYFVAILRGMPEIGNWSINRLLSTAARMLEHSWNNQLKELGLTHAGVTALDVIAREGTISQVRVASIVGVQAQTMGKTLARLEAHGHVFRTRNTVDRRSYLLGVTPRGKEVLAQAEQIDRNLASTGELAKPEFREMLIHIVRELSKQEGNDAVLRGSHEEHRASLGFVQPADGSAQAAQDAPIKTESSGPITAVMETLTPEMIEEARANSQKEQ